MLVHKVDKGFISNSDNPDTNWISDNNYYVVPDGSELANRIVNAYPYFDIVNEDGNLVDIVELEKPPPEPTEFELLQEYVVDIDFRNAMMELGF